MKRIISLLIAVTMLCTLMMPIASAVDMTTVEAAAEAAQSQETAPAELETAPAELETAPAELETAPAEPEAAPAELEAAPAELEAAPAEPEAAPAEREMASSEQETVTEVEEDSSASVMSLRPMKEIRTLIMIYGYTEEQCRNFPVDKLLHSMLDESGNSVEIPADATHAWFYYTDKEFRQEFHNLNQGETIDLCSYNDWFNGVAWDWGWHFDLTVVVGNGSQVDDAGNTRYNLHVGWKETTEKNGVFKVDVVENGAQDSTTGAMRILTSDRVPCVEKYGMSGLMVDAWIDQTTGQGYTVTLGEPEKSHFILRGLDVSLYPLKNVLNHLQKGEKLTGAFTPLENGQYKLTGDFTGPVDNVDAPNLWCAVFKDFVTGETLGYSAIGVQIHIMKRPKFKLYGETDGQIELLGEYDFERDPYVEPMDECEFIVENGHVGWDSNVIFGNLINDYSAADRLFIRLPEKSLLDREYYISIPENSEIQKVTREAGYYDENGFWIWQEEDVTDQILIKEGQSNFYGWKHFWKKMDQDWNENEVSEEALHIVWNDNSYTKLTVHLEEATKNTNFQPPIYFNTYGAGYGSENSKEDLDVYAAGMVQNQALDTYYRYDEKYDVGGYQLLLIKNRFDLETAPKDIKNVFLDFNISDGVKVNSGKPLISGETKLKDAQWSENIPNTVLIQAHKPGKEVKNYQVTLATLQAGASLFVAGPDERFVNLTKDNGYIHDILIANLGEEALTGLNVELIDPVNVKLDDYWRVGGAGNDTLPAFTSTAATYDYADAQGNMHSEYQDAMLKNMAKVRLLPTGNGEISGTLRVTAANGQKRDIKLTGIAAYPNIISGQPDEAVKYVPYSFVIGTNNMYQWNTPTFYLAEGSLPKGLSLLEKTGEIYGVPLETGTFTFKVKAKFSHSTFPDSVHELTLTVKENTNENVYQETDPGYQIEQHIGIEQGTGTHDYLLVNPQENQLYVSEASFYTFMDLWLNGEKLVPGVDYEAESGSTRITIYGQTFVSKAKFGEANTLAAEFRVYGEVANELKRTAQNFRLPSATPTPNVPPVQPVNPTPGVPGANPGGNPGANPGTDSSVKPSTPKADDVHIRVYLEDENGKAMVGTHVELHSAIQTGVTNKNGCVVFRDVKFGQHTFTVKTASGEVIAKCEFNLTDGTVCISGDKVSAPKGSTIALRARVNNDTLNFVNVSVPETGDATHLSGWVIAMMISLGGCAGIMAAKKNYGSR